MEDKGYTKILFPLILFILIGSALNGSMKPSEPEPEPQYIGAHEECAKYFSDDDGDGLNGFISDDGCHDYPYSDGNGEEWLGEIQDPNLDYQIYWDLSVDLVRYFVEIECNNQLSNCAGTNFITEVQFFCWFDQNVMSNDWFSIYDRAFNQISTIQDDGSQNIYMNVCNAFPPSNQPPTLPDAGTQSSQPLADNPTGSSNGGGGMK